MRYYIADCHFFHDALNEHMDRRGFGSREEMTDYMISQWNGRVRKNDDVVILGDFSVGRGPETNQLLQALNGRKYLIIGNHDWYLSDKKFDHSLFVWEENYKELNDDGRKVCLSHYPMMVYNRQLRLNENGKPHTYMLYGHVHNTVDEELVLKYQLEAREIKRHLAGSNEEVGNPVNMINCFCMYSDYVPLTLDQWIGVQQKREEEFRKKQEK